MTFTFTDPDINIFELDLKSCRYKQYVLLSEPIFLGNVHDTGVSGFFWRLPCMDGLRFGVRLRLD